jgi:hypothetical protein
MYKKDKEQQEELNQGRHQCTMCSAVIYELPTILCWETWDATILIEDKVN